MDCIFRIRGSLAVACLLLSAGLTPAWGQNDTAGEPIRSGNPLGYRGPASSSAPSKSDESYTHITSTDNWDPNSFWYTNRPNMLNQDVPSEWDAMKLVNTDRPDFTDVGTTVGKGISQLETGYTYFYRNTATNHFNFQSMPEYNLRVGTTDTFEWRLKWQGVLFTRETDVPSGQTAALSGAADPSIGFKWVIKKQDDWRPMHTIVTNFSVPAGSSDFSANSTQEGLNWVYNWQVRKWLFVRGSSGVDFLRRPGTVFTSVPSGGGPGAMPVFFTGREHVTEGHQSVSAYWQLSQRVGYFTEWYMLYRHGTGATDNRPDHFHDYGVYYYLSPNWQLDARIGQELSTRVHEVFTGAGISARW